MSLLPYNSWLYQPFGHWFNSELQSLQRELGLIDETKEGDFKYTCNVHGFKPDEIECHQEGECLVINAHQKHDGPNEKCERTMKRVVRMPPDVHFESVRCEVNDKGELMVKAQKKALGEAPKRAIPVTFKPAESQKK